MGVDPQLPQKMAQLYVLLLSVLCVNFLSARPDSDLDELGQNINNIGNNLNQGLGDMFKDFNNAMDNYEKSMNEASSQATWAWIKLIAIIGGGFFFSAESSFSAVAV